MPAASSATDGDNSAVATDPASDGGGGSIGCSSVEGDETGTGSSASQVPFKQIVIAPNEIYGPKPTIGVGAEGNDAAEEELTDAAGAARTAKVLPFDCAPPDGICVEPQYWFYRQAEMVASGKRQSGCI